MAFLPTSIQFNHHKEGLDVSLLPQDILPKSFKHHRANPFKSSSTSNVMEHNFCNPFVPRASVVRYPNAIFEIRLHLNGIALCVEVVQHDNYVLVTGRLVPRAKKDCQGLISNLIWSDQACGNFGRDIPLRLNPGTQILILERYQDCGDFVIRYTIRNSPVSVPTCAQYAQLDAYSARQCRPHNQDICGGNGGLAGAWATPCGKGAGCTCPPGAVGLNGGQGVWQNQGAYQGQGYHYPSGCNIGASFNAGVSTTTAPQPAVAQVPPNQEGLPL
ncbi:hypothetical protein BU17DRAFT_93154 [Hysterangium stoloniferum]|nr:hypothetical protein BU17DRAFT_93154 [Hysterangium stoloniferum]